MDYLETDNTGAAAEPWQSTGLGRRLAQLFARIDVNGDGAISRAELAHKLRVDTELQMMMDVAGKMPAYVFEQLDGDGDGSITLEEFVCLVEPDDADEDYDPDEEEEPEGEPGLSDDDDERRPGQGEQDTGELAALEQELVELQREAESLGLEEHVKVRAPSTCM